MILAYIAAYLVIILYLIGFRVYLEIILPDIKEETALYLECILLGGTNCVSNSILPIASLAVFIG